MQVSNFQAQTRQDYARPNLFEVTIQGSEQARFMCKAASIPAVTVGVVEVPFMNRKLKVPGDRTFQDWTVTVINDQEFQVRKALMTWQHDITSLDNPWSSLNPFQSHRTLNIIPIDRSGTAIGRSILSGWPSEIGAIDMSWESTDAVQEYTVTFSVTWNNGM